MPAIVNPPPKWVWHHAPKSLKIFFAVAAGSFALTSLISLRQYVGLLRRGRDIKNDRGEELIQLPMHAQRLLEIVQKPWLLSFFALLSMAVMPFARIFDIILAVTLSVVVKDFADLCVARFKNSDKLFGRAAAKPQKWYSRGPCCCWTCCVKLEPLQLKHLKRANQCVWWYVTFIPFNAMISMIMDTAFAPQIELDHGYCLAASANTNPPYDHAGRLTLVTTMFGMWGVGSMAAAVDLCYGADAKATQQLNFIRMYQLLGLLKPLILHYSRPLTYPTPTWPMATITNLNATLTTGAEATSSVVNCPVFDYDSMSRISFLTFTCVWMLLVALGNQTKFTLEHEEAMQEQEKKMEESTSRLLNPPPIQETLG